MLYISANLMLGIACSIIKNGVTFEDLQVFVNVVGDELKGIDSNIKDVTVQYPNPNEQMNSWFININGKYIVSKSPTYDLFLGREIESFMYRLVRSGMTPLEAGDFIRKVKAVYQERLFALRAHSVEGIVKPYNEEEIIGPKR